MPTLYTSPYYENEGDRGSVTLAVILVLGVTSSMSSHLIFTANLCDKRHHSEGQEGFTPGLFSSVTQAFPLTHESHEHI